MFMVIFSYFSYPRVPLHHVFLQNLSSLFAIFDLPVIQCNIIYKWDDNLISHSFSSFLIFLTGCFFSKIIFFDILDA